MGRRGLFVNLFAGGGGTSKGGFCALGFDPDIAINHDPVAIAMHRINHPTTKHYTSDVWEVHPKDATGDEPVALLWASPDCKHFSKAKGGKPVEKKIRSLAWVVVKWAKIKRPKVIIIENVEEFQDWGPLLCDGSPDKKRKGQTFSRFVSELTRLGYKVEWNELSACDYGAPTIRKRLFLIARCDGQKIVWAEPTHGDPEHWDVKNGFLKPWKTAADIIDWSIPCPSIFNRNKPLADNTLKRIARGLEKFVFDNPNPFIVQVNHDGGAFRGHCTVDHHSLVTATIITNTSQHAPTDINSPVPTLTTGNQQALMTSHMIKLRGQNIGFKTDSPVHTITSGGTHIGEVRAFLIKYYGQGLGQTVREPLHTITSKDTFGVVTVQGVDYRLVDIGLRMLQPHELFAAQGFPEDYIINFEHDGKPLSKSAQVRLCGNCVCPQVAEALIKANCMDFICEKAAV